MTEEHKTNLIKNLKMMLTCDDNNISKYYHKVKEILSSQKPKKSIKLSRTKVKKVKPVDNTQSTDVYDIGMRNDHHPWFFANNMLVHNSVYFSAWPIIRDSVERGETDWNKEICIQIYNSIADQLNESFPSFMERAFNCPREMGSIIQGGRELIASKGLFIKKKRYGVLIFDKENHRLDINGKTGKVKAMGLDLKRSDTPKVVQDFLSQLLQSVLNGADREEVIQQIKLFKEQFKSRPAWEKGTPKRVNNLTSYTKNYEKTGRCRVGHVMAAINWNRLRKMHGDNYSGAITDGQKVIVCKLKSNPLNITSIAYPTDQAHLPEWFKELPFDNSEMEDTIVTQKVENLLGVLNWNLRTSTGSNNVFADMFHES